MAPSRKSKSMNKRFTREASPEVDLRNSSKTKQGKKRLTDKLGPQWTKGELERFYDAYRKHGMDWEKVAAAVRNNRSVDMVEALFNMNRAYLSLPEGIASVAALIAMMTDHYSGIEESESEEEEGHVASGVSRKYQRRKLAEVPPSDFREEVIPPHSIASTEGCLSFLKLTQAYGNERRATGKRTPRFPVPSAYQRDDKEGSTPPNKRAKNQREADDDDDNDDDGDDMLALALATIAGRIGVSTYRRTEVNDSTSNGKMSQAKESQSKHRASSLFENVVRISRDRKHKQGASDRNGALLMDMKGVGTVEVPQKGKNVRFEEAERDASDNSGEARSANDGLISRDEFVALQALAELSGLLPLAGLAKSAADNRKPESAQEIVDDDAVSIGELGTSKRKRKPLHNKESAEDDNLKTLIKARRPGQAPAKQLKNAKTSKESSSISDKKITGPDAVVSATQVSGSGPASLPQKPPNRRKMSLKKSLQERVKSAETTHEKPHSYETYEHELLKEKDSTCLSCPLVRRRCIFEWFYSAIDYPWFAKMEFTDYLNHLGLGHVSRFTRLEWSLIKSSLGRTRRFSEKFIQEEREKLKQYREYMRKHYTELRAGARKGLPTDLAQPLSVGNRVIAIHPKTREIRDGKILTMDHNKCNVLFDELGVDLVVDIDCMPVNPLEYIPDGLRQIDNCLSISEETQINRHPSSDASALFPLSVLESVDFSMNTPEKQDDRDRRVTIDQSYNIANSKARRDETQRALVLRHTSDAQEMDPEMLGIVNGSRSIAQAMVDAAMKAASLVKDAKDAGDVVQQGLDSIGEHQPLYNSIVAGIKHQDQSNGSLDHHRIVESMTRGLTGSGQTETQMDSELISSCVSTWLMIQMCTEKQYPPAVVAQVMETAVTSLQPRCPENMRIYREIQTCMGWIKYQIMALVKH